MDIQAGTLYLVSTPIGTLEDITLRALSVLKQVDLVAAEDTRHTRELLAHFDIHTRLVSCHAFNEHARVVSFESSAESKAPNRNAFLQQLPFIRMALSSSLTCLEKDILVFLCLYSHGTYMISLSSATRYFSYITVFTCSISARTSDDVAPPWFTVKPACFSEICAPPIE